MYNVMYTYTGTEIIKLSTSLYVRTSLNVNKIKTSWLVYFMHKQDYLQHYTKYDVENEESALDTRYTVHDSRGNFYTVAYDLPTHKC